MSQSISDVAKLYNVSINTIGYHMKRNELEFEYIGGKRFISDEHIKQLSNYINVQHTSNVEDREDNNKNTTSNNDDEYIQALKDHIESLKNEVSSKKYTIEDYSKKLDKAHELLSQQQSLQLDSNNKISKLENEVEQYKLEDSSNSKRVLKVKSRVKVNDVEDVDVKEDVSDTNIDSVKEDKPKGFFAKLFNL